MDGLYTHLIEMPEDFQETAKKSVRRLMRQYNECWHDTDGLSTPTVDYLDILGSNKSDPEITKLYEKFKKCSEFGSMQTKTISDPLFGQLNIPIGVVDMETDTQSLSLTLIKKRTSSDNGLKPQILILKNGKKLLSQIDSLNQIGLKGEQEGNPL